MEIRRNSGPREIAFQVVLAGFYDPEVYFAESQRVMVALPSTSSPSASGR